jgi:hypothetical protein
VLGDRHSSLPGVDLSRAVRLWEAESLEAVRNLVEGAHAVGLTHVPV